MRAPRLIRAFHRSQFRQQARQIMLSVHVHFAENGFDV